MKRTGSSYRSFFSFVFLVIFAVALFSGEVVAAGSVAGEFSLPVSAVVCGEKIDLSGEYNRKMYDREFTIISCDRAQIFMWLKRAGRYFTFFEMRLKEEGLPEDLKYLAVVESSLHAHVRSRDGALGIWQLMPVTARGYGLRIEKGVVDERLCFERSTDAALAYLKYLKGRFGNWTLAMAAYNCGEGMIAKAIKNQKTRSYFHMELPRETERYIFRVAAVKEVMGNPGRYGCKPDPSRFWLPVPREKFKLNLKGWCSIYDLAEETSIGYKEFMELNPEFIGTFLPAGTGVIRLPPGKSADVAEFIRKHENFRLSGRKKGQGRYYIVKRGDVLSRISRKTGVPVEIIKKMNGLASSLIIPGQKLIVNP